MKAIQLKLSLILLVISLISCHTTTTKNYLQYVDQLIGTAHSSLNNEVNRSSEYTTSGHTIPAVSAPFGMTQWTLQSQSSEKKCVPPFYSGRIRFQGIRATHWMNGTCSKDYGSFTVFPTSLKNRYRFLPRQRETMYMYNSEITSPAYLSVMMPEQNIMSEITATKRSAIFRFSWLTPEIPTIIIDINSDEGKGYIKVDLENGEIYGYNPVYINNNGKSKHAGIAGYFVAKFDTKIINSGTYSGMKYEHGVYERKNQKNIGAYVSFDLSSNKAVRMKIGTSFTSIENARENLDAEISDWNFNKIKTNLENIWNDILGRIDVESNNSDELTKFYTSLYHSFLQPHLFSDVNGEYPGYANDSIIHVANGFNYYGDFASWNSYRTQMPLLSLIAPREYNDMIKSLIKKAEQGGWLPATSEMNNYSAEAIGDFSSTIIADACMKGFDFDLEKAYKYLRKNAFEPSGLNDYIDGKGRRSLNSYLEFGYIPLEDEVIGENLNGGQVSRTLNYAYNDWCVAQVARKLGKTNDYDELLARSYNYTNLFDFEKATVCGKYANDTFTDEFNANKMMPYIIEGTPKQYTFFVPHDVDGLFELLNGKEIFQQKLDEININNELWAGNEPSQLIPYLYNFIGKWDKTQILVKKILELEYTTEFDGYLRNDYAGQMSAWYIFSSIGFYPTCPGNNQYQLSSPIFDKVTLNLDKDYYPGGSFIFETSTNNGNPFSKVELNGKEIEPVITHKNIQDGGKLIFSEDK